MPTYEYVCEACKHAWELEQRMVDEPVKKCPKCKKMKAKRMISGGGNFILKGGGWYSDLYSSASRSKVKTDSGLGHSSSTSSTTKGAPASTTPSTSSTQSASAPSSTPSSKPKAAAK